MVRPVGLRGGNAVVRLVAGLTLVTVAACSGGRSGSAPGGNSPGPAVSPVPTVTSTVVSTGRVADSVPTDASTIRIALVGDVMLGRGVAPVISRDPDSVFAEVRPALATADIAAANLESPLTSRRHLATNPNALEADPSAASILAGTGFDVLNLANNHAGDAGRASITDTIDALAAAGMLVVGGGADQAAAAAPLVVERSGIRVVFLAFDATGAGTPATDDAPGIVPWDAESAGPVVEAVREEADVVVVSVHGGVEYLGAVDPVMDRIAAQLLDWGADVVWGHHAHVVGPVQAERGAVVATSLGNFLFDQGAPGTTEGLILEILATRDGAIGYRTASTSHPDRRVHFDGWELPTGDAVFVDGAWWTPVRPVTPSPQRSVPTPDEFAMGDIVTWAGEGDATGDGAADWVVSYRHARRDTPINRYFGDRVWTDGTGRSAHLGVFDHETLVPVWASGTMFLPATSGAVCDGSVALAFSRLDDPAVIATGVWVWRGFGFSISPLLPGTGTASCADFDADGHLDPAITNRG